MISTVYNNSYGDTQECSITIDLVDALFWGIFEGLSQSRIRLLVWGPDMPPRSLNLMGEKNCPTI